MRKYEIALAQKPMNSRWPPGAMPQVNHKPPCSDENRTGSGSDRVIEATGLKSIEPSRRIQSILTSLFQSVHKQEQTQSPSVRIAASSTRSLPLPVLFSCEQVVCYSLSLLTRPARRKKLLRQPLRDLSSKTSLRQIDILITTHGIQVI